MLFLHAFFHLFSAFVQTAQDLLWKARRLLRIRHVTIRPFPGYQFRALLKGFVIYLAYLRQPLRRFRKSFEYPVFAFLKDHIQAGDCVVDVGANVGLLSLYMSKLVGPHGKVFSIEASTANAQILLENAEANDMNNITVINHAVTQEESLVYMTSPIAQHNDALLVMRDAYTEGAEPITGFPFDHLVQQWKMKKVKLIKIDIEGAEMLFFKGSTEFFNQHKPILIFETLEPYCNRFGHSSVDVLLSVKALGYQIKQLDIETWTAIYISDDKTQI